MIDEPWQTLADLRQSLFGWIDSDVQMGMMVSVSVAMLLLGIVYLAAKPRVTGLILILLGFAITVYGGHVWGKLVVYRFQSEGVHQFVPVVVAGLIGLAAFFTARRADARTTGQRVPLVVLAAGIWLWAGAQLAEFTVYRMHDDAMIPYNASYVVAFLPPALLVLGLMAAHGSLLAALIMRVVTAATSPR